MRKPLGTLLASLLALVSGTLCAQQRGLKIDEPRFQIPLSAQTAGTTPGCPAGFYSLLISDGADFGNAPGAYSSELLLLEPGTRLFAGGLNFGGLADHLAPGFAAVTIANTANENQQIRVTLTGSQPNSSAAVRARVTLRSREPSPVATVFTQDLAILPTTPFVRTEVVPPGFYELVVTPLDDLPGADALLQIGLESSYVGRTGGGFQGGVNFGGYHDPAGAGVSGISGFGALCLADAHTVSVRTIGRATNPGFGAGDLRIRLVRDNSTATTIYDSQEFAPLTLVQGTLRVTNQLSTPLLSVEFNGQALGSLAPLQSRSVTYLGAPRGNVRLTMARSEGLGRSENVFYSPEVVYTASGQTQTVNIRHNNLYHEVATGARTLAPVALYSPQIDQNYTTAVQVRFYDGLDEDDYSQLILSGTSTTIVNRTFGLSPAPRVYFPIVPGQSAHIRAFTQTGASATLYQESYDDLVAATSGDVVGTVTQSTFLAPPACTTPTYVVANCVDANTVVNQTLSMGSAGALDTIRFTLCPGYNSATPNTLRVSRPAAATNAGLNLSLARASGSIVAGPTAVTNGAALNVALTGNSGVAGETYCASLRQVAPWDGSFEYQFRLLGSTSAE